MNSTEISETHRTYIKEATDNIHDSYLFVVFYNLNMSQNFAVMC